jgi:hypothetical protein
LGVWNGLIQFTLFQMGEFNWKVEVSPGKDCFQSSRFHCTYTYAKYCIWSQSHIASDGQSITKSWCWAPSGSHDQIFITVWQLQSCFCGAPSLSRGRVRLLYMLLALASVVFLRSESLGTRDHILLSQIWDFPFCRLLRLTGSRWRYSNPSPLGCCIRPRYFTLFTNGIFRPFNVRWDSGGRRLFGPLYIICLHELCRKRFPAVPLLLHVDCWGSHVITTEPVHWRAGCCVATGL